MHQPSNFDSYDVKYGSLSLVNALFATLPDLLWDPIAQTEFELDTLDAMLQQVSSNNASLTNNAFMALKSDLDTLMYHEDMIAMDNQEFCDAMEDKITELEKQNT